MSFLHFCNNNGLFATTTQDEWIKKPTTSSKLDISFTKAFKSGAVEEYPNTTVGFVHIDDVVAAHILAMEKKEAAGRLICSCTVAHWTEVLQMLKAKYPSYPYVDK